MTAVAAFRSALDDRGVEVVETAEDDLAEALETVVEPPAVGVPLADLPVDLEALSVDIDTEPTPDALDGAATGITPAAFGIADYGSVVIQGGPEGAEPASLYPEHHVAVLRAEDVLPDMLSAVEAIDTAIQDGGRSHVIATGPSATADMGELVEGAHGPKAVTVVVMSE